MWAVEDIADLEATSDAILSNLGLVVNRNKVLAIVGVAVMS